MELRATGMLVLTTLVWGLSFPLVKDWHELARGCPGGEIVASSTLIAVRMGLALAVLAVLQPELVRRPTRREHAIGALIGLVFFSGFLLQVIGLAETTPAHSAFFTSLGSVWVPVLAFVIFRATVSLAVLLGLLTAAAGAAVLLFKPEDAGWNRGDVLTLCSSLFWAAQIILLDRLGRTVRSTHLTASLFVVSTVGGLAAVLVSVVVHGHSLAEWLAWFGQMLAQPRVPLTLGLLALFCTVLAFRWMNQYQPQVSAARAGLIYFLEPLFGTLFSILWKHDELTLRLIEGGLLILAGNLLAELPRVLGQSRSEQTAPAGE